MAGNFGTIDVGRSNNSADDLSDQIKNGITETDLEQLGINVDAGEGLVISEESRLVVSPDTGLTTSIGKALEVVLGLPRAVALFSGVEGQGEAGQYTLVDIQGIRVMEVDLQGSRYLSI